MGLASTGGNAMLTGLVGAGAYLSLHDGDPGTTGANEASYASGARYHVTAWGTPSSSELDHVEDMSWAVPAGSYTHWGLWTASTGGSFVVGGKLSRALVLAAAATATLTALDLTAGTAT